MSATQDERDSALVRQSGIVVIALHLAYAAVTITGFVSLRSAAAAIGDPWFALMEWLIILIGPAVLLFLSALGSLGGARKAWSRASLALAAVNFALSAGLHVVILVIGREDALVSAGGALSFTWPSIAYAIDILAWDWFFALSLVCAAVAIRTVPDMAVASRAFAFAGLLSLAGLAGPVSGAMTLRNIGILGYAVCFPTAVALVVRALARQPTD